MKNGPRRASDTPNCCAKMAYRLAENSGKPPVSRAVSRSIAPNITQRRRFDICSCQSRSFSTSVVRKLPTVYGFSIVSRGAPQPVRSWFRATSGSGEDPATDLAPGLRPRIDRSDRGRAPRFRIDWSSRQIVGVATAWRARGQMQHARAAAGAVVTRYEELSRPDHASIAASVAR